MASKQQLKRRIGSVKSTKQITKAMQLVSASKLRRAQEAAIGPREYARSASELLTRIRQLTDVDRYALYEKRDSKARLIIIITSDRSLAGAYNSNVLKQLIQELKKDQAAGVASQVIDIGRQGTHLVTRLRDLKVAGVYQNLPDHPSSADIEPVIATAIRLFTDKEVDAVDVIYTDYISTVTQKVTVHHLLPAGFSDEEISENLASAEFEPSPEAVLESVTPRLLQAQLLQAMLESKASEEAMRMLAMKNATDNASELIDDLTLAFNNARQAGITQELAEISGGVEAMKEQ
jgi:F-type H+-transporting ATPase subunit gamma